MKVLLLIGFILIVGSVFLWFGYKPTGVSIGAGPIGISLEPVASKSGVSKELRLGEMLVSYYGLDYKEMIHQSIDQEVDLSTVTKITFDVRIANETSRDILLDWKRIIIRASDGREIYNHAPDEIPNVVLAEGSRGILPLHGIETKGLLSNLKRDEKYSFTVYPIIDYSFEGSREVFHVNRRYVCGNSFRGNELPRFIMVCRQVIVEE